MITVLKASNHASQNYRRSLIPVGKAFSSVSRDLIFVGLPLTRGENREEFLVCFVYVIH